jgi:L-2,4-diaminobutyric acid acetyltransferase
LLVCTHFPDTSVVAEADGQLLGFVSGYLVPARPDTMFVWQVAVAEAARGRGLGRRMLNDVLGRPACAEVRFLNTTVTPSNVASWALFRAVARDHDAECSTVDTFRGAEVGGSDHEDEQLLRIGPLTGPKQGGS